MDRSSLPTAFPLGDWLWKVLLASPSVQRLVDVAAALAPAGAALTFPDGGKDGARGLGDSWGSSRRTAVWPCATGWSVCRAISRNRLAASTWATLLSLSALLAARSRSSMFIASSCGPSRHQVIERACGGRGAAAP